MLSWRRVILTLYQDHFETQQVTAALTRHVGMGSTRHSAISRESSSPWVLVSTTTTTGVYCTSLLVARTLDFFRQLCLAEYTIYMAPV